MVMSQCFTSSNTYNYADSGTIYSTGWPSGYSSSFTACDYQISKRAKYSRVYIAFMDVSMYPYGYPRDCVKMSGTITLMIFEMITCNVSTYTYMIYKQFAIAVEDIQRYNNDHNAYVYSYFNAKYHITTQVCISTRVAFHIVSSHLINLLLTLISTSSLVY